MKPEQKLDETDIKILQTLLKDARSNFRDIAKECNISITAISKRYQKLKRTGVITGTAIISTTQNGAKQHSLSVDIIAQSQHETEIIDAIKMLPHVLSCFKVIGKYDIHAAIAVQTLEQISQIKTVIKQQKGVIDIEITPSLDELCFFPENLSF